MNNVRIANTTTRARYSLSFSSCFASLAPAQDKNPNKLDETFLKNLQFRSIGPAIMGGRIDDIAVVESNPSVYYVGAATGGVWKTVNNGTTFEPIFDTQPNTSIGDIAIAPSDPNIIWVGTGEANNRQSSSWGDGIYRSLGWWQDLDKHGTARHETHWPRGD